MATVDLFTHPLFARIAALKDQIEHDITVMSNAVENRRAAQSMFDADSAVFAILDTLRSYAIAEAA